MLDFELLKPQAGWIWFPPPIFWGLNRRLPTQVLLLWNTQKGWQNNNLPFFGNLFQWWRVPMLIMFWLLATLNIGQLFFRWIHLATDSTIFIWIVTMSESVDSSLFIFITRPPPPAPIIVNIQVCFIHIFDMGNPEYKSGSIDLGNLECFCQKKSTMFCFSTQMSANGLSIQCSFISLYFCAFAPLYETTSVTLFGLCFTGSQAHVQVFSSVLETEWN